MEPRSPAAAPAGRLRFCREVSRPNPLLSGFEASMRARPVLCRISSPARLPEQRRLECTGWTKESLGVFAAQLAGGGAFALGADTDDVAFRQADSALDGYRLAAI